MADAIRARIFHSHQPSIAKMTIPSEMARLMRVPSSPAMFCGRRVNMYASAYPHYDGEVFLA
jgi:hypothetical protein